MRPKTAQRHNVDGDEEEDLVLFDELDPAEVTLQAQRSLHKLRQARDDGMKQVKIGTLARFAAVRKRASTVKEASHEQQTRQSKAALIEIMDLLNKRREVEALFKELLRKAIRVVDNYVKLVIAGCEGRQAEAQRHLSQMKESSDAAA